MNTTDTKEAMGVAHFAGAAGVRLAHEHHQVLPVALQLLLQVVWREDLRHRLFRCHASTGSTGLLMSVSLTISCPELKPSFPQKVDLGCSTGAAQLAHCIWLIAPYMKPGKLRY